MCWRRLFPRTGAAYELFDAGIFLLILALVGYVLTSPTSSQQRTLSAPLDLLPDYVWGTALAAVSVYAIVCSYYPRWVRRGYLAMISACAFWSANFGIGMAFGAIGAALPGHFLDAYEFSIRSIISVLLYGWITSRLVRDLPKEVEE